MQEAPLDLRSSRSQTSSPLALALATTVIPVHNHKNWVAQAIESVTRQDYPNKRLILVDDGSTDGSTEVITSLFSPCKYLEGNKENQLAQWVGSINSVPSMLVRLPPRVDEGKPKGHGPAFARNLGIKIGWDTDVFFFLDSDDFYEPGKISKSIKVWQEYPDIGVVYSDYDTLSTETGLRLRQYKEAYSRWRLQQECIVNCNSMVSKKALEVCGLFPELRVCEDYALWLSISKKFMLYRIPESLVTIRVGPHSSSSTVPKEVWQACYQKAFQS